MKKLLSKASRLKKVLAFVMCSALILGEIPAGIIKADADSSDVRIELVGSVDDEGTITLKAKVVDAPFSTTGSYTWYQTDGSDNPSLSATNVICNADSITLNDLYTLWKEGEAPKIKDTTEVFRIVSAYNTTQEAAPDTKVTGDYSWKVNDNEAEVEIDSFEGVSVQNASGETSTNGTLLGLKGGMKVLDKDGNEVTNNGGLAKGDYVVTLTYEGAAANITLKAKYEIKTADASESFAPAESSSPSAAPTEAATTQPSEEPPVLVPTETPDIGQPPVEQPTQAPVVTSSAVPTEEPTIAPTEKPTEAPTVEPTKAPEVEPTIAPTVEPTVKPSEEPELKPTEAPAEEPTAGPETDKTVTVGKAEFKVDDKSQSVAYEGTSSASKNITIPATVKVNGVSYPVTTVSAGAFKNSKVQSVTIGSNVTTLGKNAFKGCKKLTKVTIGTKVKTVGVSAFEGCTKLKSVSLPTSAKTIGAKAFKGCKKLKKVTIGKAVIKTRKAQILFGSYNQNKTLFAAPESTKVSIGASAFQNCVKLRSVIINSQVTKIGSKTFQHCKELARVLVKSLKLQAVGNNALKGVNNCKISVPTIRLRKYRTLFKNKGQGRKVVIAKA